MPPSVAKMTCLRLPASRTGELYGEPYMEERDVAR